MWLRKTFLLLKCLIDKCLGFATSTKKAKVAEMEIELCHIPYARKNKVQYVVLVKRDEKYEEAKQKAWEKLINK